MCSAARMAVLVLLRVPTPLVLLRTLQALVWAVRRKLLLHLMCLPAWSVLAHGLLLALGRVASASSSEWQSLLLPSSALLLDLGLLRLSERACFHSVLPRALLYRKPRQGMWLALHPAESVCFAGVMLLPDSLALLPGLLGQGLVLAPKDVVSVRH